MHEWQGKIGNSLQAGGIETAVLDNGPGRGARVAWVNTGADLRFHHACRRSRRDDEDWNYQLAAGTEAEHRVGPRATAVPCELAALGPRGIRDRPRTGHQLPDWPDRRAQTGHVDYARTGGGTQISLDHPGRSYRPTRRAKSGVKGPRKSPWRRPELNLVPHVPPHAVPLAFKCGFCTQVDAVRRLRANVTRSSGPQRTRRSDLCEIPPR